MIAALPMYDRAEVAQANDQLWAAIQSILGYGPVTLTRDMDVWDIWQSPDLLLAQTCGYAARFLYSTPAYYLWANQALLQGNP